MPKRRTSVDAKIRAGTFRPSTARDVVELPPGTPRAPKWLEPEAKAEWTRVVRALSEAGALSEAHRSTLVVYCTLWAEFEQAHGQMPTARLGELRRLTTELGISPKSGTVGPAPKEPAPPARNVTPLVTGISERLRGIIRSTEHIPRLRAKPAEQPPEEPLQKPKP
jgi:hypothetical protein